MVTDANGNAQTTWTLGPLAGAHSLSATAAGLTGSPVTFTATAISTTPTALFYTVAPTTTQAGATLGPIVVAARDAQGAVATGFMGTVSLAIGANPGGGTLAGTAVANAVAGAATFTGLSIDRTGVGYTLVATSGALTSATSAPFNIVAGPAATLAFTVPPTGAVVGAPITPAVQVAARDALENAATTFTGAVTIAIGSNPGGATLGGTVVVNAIAGVATFSTLTLSATGAGYTLTASAAALTAATSAPFSIGSSIISWTNAAGGNWSTPGSWSLGRVPNATDSVVINLTGTYTVALNMTVTAAFITVGGGSGTVTTVAGSVLRVTPGDPSGTTNTLTVASGFTNLGTIELTNTFSTFGSDAVLTVSAGTLVNATVGTISALHGLEPSGVRTLTAQLDNQGAITLSPGAANILTVNGNVTTSGIITLDIGGLTVGTLYDRLAVTGTLALGGTLNVGFFGGFTPVATNTFTVLTSTGATTGTFATTNLAPPLSATPAYNANSVVVSVP